MVTVYHLENSDMPNLDLKESFARCESWSHSSLAFEKEGWVSIAKLLETNGMNEQADYDMDG